LFLSSLQRFYRPVPWFAAIAARGVQSEKISGLAGGKAQAERRWGGLDWLA
jgi:hypothetical protein